MKGSVLDIGVIATILLALGLSILFAYTIYSSMADQTISIVQNNSELNKSKYDLVNEINKVDSKMRFNFEMYDKVFLLVFFALSFTTVWLARNINTHPVFFVVSVFALMVSVIAAWIVQNIYYYFASNSLIQSYANDMVSINTVLNNIPVIGVVLFVFIIIAMYAGKSGGQDWRLMD